MFLLLSYFSEEIVSNYDCNVQQRQEIIGLELTFLTLHAFLSTAFHCAVPTDFEFF